MRVERAVVDEENYLRLRIRAEEEEMEREKLKKIIRIGRSITSKET